MSLTILHDFSVEGTDYRLAREGSYLSLFLRNVDRFGQSYTQEQDHRDYAKVLAQMANPHASYAMFSSHNWAERWKAISTPTKDGAHVLLGPNAAVEVLWKKARALRREEATGLDLTRTLDRWVVEEGSGATQWYLEVILKMLEVEL